MGVLLESSVAVWYASKAITGKSHLREAARDRRATSAHSGRLPEAATQAILPALP